MEAAACGDPVNNNYAFPIRTTQWRRMCVWGGAKYYYSIYYKNSTYIIQLLLQLQRYKKKSELHKKGSPNRTSEDPNHNQINMKNFS